MPCFRLVSSLSLRPLGALSHTPPLFSLGPFAFINALLFCFLEKTVPFRIGTTGEAQGRGGTPASK